LSKKISETLGGRIAQARREFAARERRDVSPPDAAALLGVSVPTYWRWERDERKPGRPALMAIALVFGCPLEFLLDEAPASTPDKEAVQEPTAKIHPLQKEVTRFPVAEPIIHDRRKQKGKGRKHG
jgi:transcriptional regulator with XRE-family HTH domain